MYFFNWNIIFQYKNIFIEGSLVTIELTLLSVIGGTILGIAIGLARRSNIAIVQLAARVYIEIFRALPILVLLIWIFYVVPIVFSWKFSPFVAAWIGLSLNLSAFVAEVVRSGIQAIPQNQYEAGIVLGLRPIQVMFKIVLPQTFRNILPGLMGMYIATLKDSSLASVIAVNELLHRSNILISNTFRPIEIYTSIAVMYLAIILPVTFLSRRLEKRLSVKTRNI